MDYLKHNFNFTTDGIDLFKDVNNKINLIDFSANMKGKTRESKNPQGYIVGTLRKQLQ